MFIPLAVQTAFDDCQEAGQARIYAEVAYNAMVRQIEEALTAPGKKLYAEDRKVITDQLAGPRRAKIAAEQAHQVAVRELEDALVAAGLPLEPAWIEGAMDDLRTPFTAVLAG